MSQRELLDIQDSKGDGLSNLLLMDRKQHSSKGTTFRPEPSSALLRAKAFLPQLASANTALEERLKTESADSVNVEHIEGDEANIIEMNVALYEDSSSSDDEAADQPDAPIDDSGDDEPMFSAVSESNIKLPTQTKSTKKPGIEVIENTGSDNPKSDSA